MTSTTALVAVTDTDSLIDGAVIGACLILILAVGTWWDRKDRRNPIPVPDDLPVLRHAKCVHPGCPTMLCFCPTLHPKTGQPVTCTGAGRPACHHSLVSRATTGGHCIAHQRECPDCRAEDFVPWGSVS